MNRLPDDGDGRAPSAADALRAPLTLPCGAVLPNRIAKAAMSEQLADTRNGATPALATLYETWSRGGAGLLLTGNVQVDRDHLEHPGNVVIDDTLDEDQLNRLRAWSAAAGRSGAQIWMQLAHAGRQTDRWVNAHPKAPSTVPLNMGGIKFGAPEPLTEPEILALIERFARAAEVARDTGFGGVQLHAAHGYLFSQFLSPLSNQRADAWGGSLEARARFLLESVRAARARVGPDFPIAVKLNSSDFQRGGFSVDESQQVAAWLEAASVDLIEISGGTYEQPSMTGIEGFSPVVDPLKAEVSRDKESYFAKFAPALRRRLSRTKLMVTGGFRSAEGMARAVVSGDADLVGLAKPLCYRPGAPAAILAGRPPSLEGIDRKLKLGVGPLGPKSPVKIVRAINVLGATALCNDRIRRLAAGQDVDPALRLLPAFLRAQKQGQAMAAALQRPPPHPATPGDDAATQTAAL